MSIEEKRLIDVHQDKHRAQFEVSQIKNRLNKLQQIESKMLIKIGKARVEAEKAHRSKESNIKRLSDRAKVLEFEKQERE